MGTYVFGLHHSFSEYLPKNRYNDASTIREPETSQPSSSSQSKPIPAVSHQLGSASCSSCDGCNLDRDYTPVHVAVIVPDKGVPLEKVLRAKRKTRAHRRTLPAGARIRHFLRTKRVKRDPFKLDTPKSPRKMCKVINWLTDESSALTDGSMNAGKCSPFTNLPFDELPTLKKTIGSYLSADMEKDFEWLPEKDYTSTGGKTTDHTNTTLPTLTDYTSYGPKEKREEIMTKILDYYTDDDPSQVDSETSGLAKEYVEDNTGFIWPAKLSDSLFQSQQPIPKLSHLQERTLPPMFDVSPPRRTEELLNFSRNQFLKFRSQKRNNDIPLKSILEVDEIKFIDSGSSALNKTLDGRVEVKRRAEIRKKVERHFKNILDDYSGSEENDKMASNDVKRRSLATNKQQEEIKCCNNCKQVLDEENDTKVDKNKGQTDPNSLTSKRLVTSLRESKDIKHLNTKCNYDEKLACKVKNLEATLEKKTCSRRPQLRQEKEHSQEEVVKRKHERITKKVKHVSEFFQKHTKEVYNEPPKEEQSSKSSNYTSSIETVTLVDQSTQWEDEDSKSVKKRSRRDRNSAATGGRQHGAEKTGDVKKPTAYRYKEGPGNKASNHHASEQRNVSGKVADEENLVLIHRTTRRIHTNEKKRKNTKGQKADVVRPSRSREKRYLSGERIKRSRSWERKKPHIAKKDIVRNRRLRAEAINEQAVTVGTQTTELPHKVLGQRLGPLLQASHSTLTLTNESEDEKGDAEPHLEDVCEFDSAVTVNDTLIYSTAANDQSGLQLNDSATDEEPRSRSNVPANQGRQSEGTRLRPSKMPPEQSDGTRLRPRKMPSEQSDSCRSLLEKCDSSYSKGHKRRRSREKSSNSREREKRSRSGERKKCSPSGERKKPTKGKQDNKTAMSPEYKVNCVTDGGVTLRLPLRLWENHKVKIKLPRKMLEQCLNVEQMKGAKPGNASLQKKAAGAPRQKKSERVPRQKMVKCKCPHNKKPPPRSCQCPKTPKPCGSPKPSFKPCECGQQPPSEPNEHSNQEPSNRARGESEQPPRPSGQSKPSVTCECANSRPPPKSCECTSQPPLRSCECSERPSRPAVQNRRQTQFMSCECSTPSDKQFSGSQPVRGIVCRKLAPPSSTRGKGRTVLHGPILIQCPSVDHQPSRKTTRGMSILRCIRTVQAFCRPANGNYLYPQAVITAPLLLRPRRAPRSNRARRSTRMSTVRKSTPLREIEPKQPVNNPEISALNEYDEEEDEFEDEEHADDHHWDHDEHWGDADHRDEHWGHYDQHHPDNGTTNRVAAYLKELNMDRPHLPLSVMRKFVKPSRNKNSIEAQFLSKYLQEYLNNYYARRRYERSYAGRRERMRTFDNFIRPLFEAGAKKGLKRLLEDDESLIEEDGHLSDGTQKSSDSRYGGRSRYNIHESYYIMR